MHSNSQNSNTHTHTERDRERCHSAQCCFGKILRKKTQPTAHLFHLFYSQVRSYETRNCTITEGRGSVCESLLRMRVRWRRRSIVRVGDGSSGFGPKTHTKIIIAFNVSSSDDAGRRSSLSSQLLLPLES